MGMGMGMALVMALVLALASTVAGEQHVLLSGNTLAAQESLSYGSVLFIMQGDCNLVLYGGRFQSNTASNGKNCTLTLDNTGRLIINDGVTGRVVWRNSNAQNSVGRYAAVLRPAPEIADVAIYGPAIWSTNDGFSYQGPGANQIALNTHNLGRETPNLPRLKSLLFSGQTLYGTDGKLSRDNNTAFELSKCQLSLNLGSEVKWEVVSVVENGKENYCRVRLDHRGYLTLLSDDNAVLFRSIPTQKVVPPIGDYVLIVEKGAAYIYGPSIWNTYDNQLVKDASA